MARVSTCGLPLVIATSALVVSVTVMAMVQLGVGWARGMLGTLFDHNRHAAVAVEHFAHDSNVTTTPATHAAPEDQISVGRRRDGPFDNRTRMNLSKVAPPQSVAHSRHTHERATSTKLKASSQPKQSNSYDIAYCLVGHLRSFAYDEVRARLRKYVFDVWRGELFINVFIEFGSTVPRSTWMKVLLELNPVDLVLRNYTEEFRDYPFRMDPNCTQFSTWPKHKIRMVAPIRVSRYRSPENDTIFTRMAKQYLKVASCYHMVEKHEHRRGAQFQYIVRLRPDMLFFSAVPTLQRLVGHRAATSHMVVIPLGVGGNEYTNDHMAICSRKICPSYFLSVEDLQKCSGDFSKTFGYMTSATPFRLKLESEKVVPNAVSMFYTLMRSGKDCKADCNRIPLIYGWHTKTCTNPACNWYSRTCFTVSKDICKRYEGIELTRVRAFTL